MAIDHSDRLHGVLYGTALGDALGLPYEGLTATNCRRRFRRPQFALLPGIGIVSDDTEQAALVAHSLLRGRADATDAAVVRRFRRALLGWFLRLPFGAGLATVRACLNIALGRTASGVRSAGNGAAMRAPLIGVQYADDRDRRLALGRALAMVTHTDPRAVDGALFAAELAARAARSDQTADRNALAQQALDVVTETELHQALAAIIAGGEASGNSGYIVHSLAVALTCFLRHGHEPLPAITAAIHAGGDTDTIAAIVGAWAGALCGGHALPAELLNRLCPGPFGRRHLAALAAALADPALPVPRYSATIALLRNLLLYPVIVTHALRRLVPA